jgi:hypothetical protein
MPSLRFAALTGVITFLSINEQVADRRISRKSLAHPQAFSNPAWSPACPGYLCQRRGSVKALCSPTSRLSLPLVAMGRDFEFTVSQDTVILESSFSHPCGVLTVSVIEKESGG